MPRIYTNFAKSTLASGIGAGDLSVTVAAGQGALFPAAGAGNTFDAVIFNTSAQREIVSCTSRTGDVLTIVRAQQGTTALAWNAADGIGHRLTKDALNNILFSANLQENTPTWCGTAGGTANALTLTPTPAITAYVAGHKFIAKISASANTTAATVAVSGLATKAIQNNGAALLAGELQADRWYEFLYDGAAFQVKKYNIGVDDGAVTYAKLAAAVQQAADSMVGLLHIDADTGHRDMIASGWMPAFFNQQWGGAPHYFELTDGATGVPYKFEAATGYIDIEFGAAIANIAGATGRSQGFKVSTSQSISALWLPLLKVGNPTNNLEVRIQADDGTGKPTANFTAITNGTATAQSGKLHSSDANGQWVRFVFATPCALVAGTQYHITAKSSGAVDAANYWAWRYKGVGQYPHGQLCTGDGVPAWSASATLDFCFLVEAATTSASLQSGGIFSDGKLVFFEGSPLNQSNGRVKDLKNFAGLDLTDFTLLVRGTAWTKDKTILDIQYGMDHDRIVLRSNVTTGFAQVDLYENDGTKHTITATSVDLSAGDHDIAISVRAKGDGADYVKLWVNGAANGTQISTATITFDALFGLAQLGTFWLGGGFQVTPAWTATAGMTVLPSADTPAWTWTGVGGVEANCFSVSGGKGYQNKNGYASTDTGYYRRAALGLSNANGWVVAAKQRVVSATNTKDVIYNHIDIFDGTKRYLHQVAEYHVEDYASGAWAHHVQGDFKTTENVHYIVGKGSDGFAFVNGRLLTDNTNQLTGATASNEITFGDGAASAGENADVTWDYVKYYTTAALLPQFTSGSLSEFAIWNGDKTVILAALYNSGNETSVKQFCGLLTNYVGDEVVQRHSQGQVTVGPTTTSTTSVLVPDMEGFAIGSKIQADLDLSFSVNIAGTVLNPAVFCDGRYTQPGSNIGGIGQPVNGYGVRVLANGNYNKEFFGIHKVEGRWQVSANTATANQRTLKIEARA